MSIASTSYNDNIAYLESGSKCKKCLKVIEQNENQVELRMKWHFNCYYCSICQKPLRPDTSIDIVKGSPICENCSDSDISKVCQCHSNPGVKIPDIIHRVFKGVPFVGNYEAVDLIKLLTGNLISVKASNTKLGKLNEINLAKKDNLKSFREESVEFYKETIHHLEERISLINEEIWLLHRENKKLMEELKREKERTQSMLEVNSDIMSNLSLTNSRPKTEQTSSIDTPESQSRSEIALPPGITVTEDLSSTESGILGDGKDFLSCGNLTSNTAEIKKLDSGDNNLLNVRKSGTTILTVNLLSEENETLAMKTSESYEKKLLEGSDIKEEMSTFKEETSILSAPTAETIDISSGVASQSNNMMIEEQNEEYSSEILESIKIFAIINDTSSPKDSLPSTPPSISEIMAKQDNEIIPLEKISSSSVKTSISFPDLMEPQNSDINKRERSQSLVTGEAANYLLRSKQFRSNSVLANCYLKRASFQSEVKSLDSLQCKRDLGSKMDEKKSNSKLQQTGLRSAEVQIPVIKNTKSDGQNPSVHSLINESKKDSDEENLSLKSNESYVEGQLSIKSKALKDKKKRNSSMINDSKNIRSLFKSLLSGESKSSSEDKGKPPDMKHEFRNQTLLRKSECAYCQQKIKTFHVSSVCKACGIITHPACALLLTGICSVNISVQNNMDTCFGVELSDQLLKENTTIPTVIKACVEAVEEKGIKVDGIYRRSGPLSQVNSLIQYFASGIQPDLLSKQSEFQDVTSVTNVIKYYLKRLPHSLVSNDIATLLGRVIGTGEGGQRLEVIRLIIEELPPSELCLLKYLCLHFNRVAENSKINTMTPKGLAVIFAPHLIRSPHEGIDPDKKNKEMVVEFLIEQAHNLFGDKSSLSSDFEGVQRHRSKSRKESSPLAPSLY